jgi:hypothetical protein
MRVSLVSVSFCAQCVYLHFRNNKWDDIGGWTCVCYIWGESNRVCRFLILHGEMRERAFLTKGICMCVRLSLRLKCLIWRRSITYIYKCVCASCFFCGPKKGYFHLIIRCAHTPPQMLCVYLYMWSLSYYYYTNLVSMYISCSSPSPQKKISHFLLITKNLRFLQLEFFAKVISVFLREIEAGCFSVAFRIYWLFLVIYRAP